MPFSANLEIKKKMMQKVPILVVAFNRADDVSKAMEAIRAYQPEELYLACDGPRANKINDIEAVKATQSAMLDVIDWPCNVHTLFREHNLGCAHAVYEAISWFFVHEEYGVIIEDDIIVSQDFFKLCEDLLPRYSNQDVIMEISAQNHSMRKDIPNTYVYAQCYHCWGWATWRRAWQRMDMSMSAAKDISIFYLSKRLGLFRGAMMYYYFKSALRTLETFNSWATRWYLSILNDDGLVLCPGVNLAINIGNHGGVHYKKGDIDPYAHLVIEQFQWPIEYNDTFKADKKQYHYDNRDFLKVRWIGLKKIFKKIRFS